MPKHERRYKYSIIISGNGHQFVNSSFAKKTTSKSNMLRFVALSSILALASAGGYNGYSRGYGGYGGMSRGFGGYSRGYSGYNGGSVGLAVQSTRAVNFVDVASSGDSAEPVNVDVYSQLSPINFNFRTRSSDININHQHESSPGSYQETSSQDEPHVSVHTVTRPVVQKLREVITPFRQITQEIQPVQEQVNTIVSRGQGYSGAARFSGGNAGYSSGAGFSGSRGFSGNSGFTGASNYDNGY